MLAPIPVTPNMDSQAQAAALNANFRQLESENRTKIIRDENGVDRVMIGRYPNGEYGIKVSKTGKDVKTADNIDLYFNSNQNTFKVVKSDTITLADYTVSGGAGVWANFQQTPVIVNHGLGYKPIVMAYLIGIGGEYTPLPFTGMRTPSTSSFESTNIGISVDGVRVIFSQNTIVNGSISSHTVYGGTIRYYLLQESVSST